MFLPFKLLNIAFNLSLISFTCAKLQPLFYYTKLLVLININDLICSAYGNRNRVSRMKI